MVKFPIALGMNHGCIGFHGLAANLIAISPDKPFAIILRNTLLDMGSDGLLADDSDQAAQGARPQGNGIGRDDQI